MQARIIALENCFQKILQERMQDVPILNSALKVQAVGFISWHNDYLGILISPWFINLILLPEKETASEQQTIGKVSTIALPAGKFEFIANHEPSLGHFLSCSLMSPVPEIDTQETAIKVSFEALKTILGPKLTDAMGDIDSRHIQRIWNGDEDIDTVPPATASDSEPTGAQHQTVEEPSRRAFFRKFADAAKTHSTQDRTNL